MHPLKPYFRGEEKPPYPRLTTCQRSFRTVDIDNVGSTYRHLTFFEMLGNFSIGDYFKQQAVEFAWDFSLNGFGFEPEKVWVTVFEGDDALGLGPDEEAIEAWLSVGVPRERIVPLSREDNFWQAGATGPCGPCSELYLDRGLEFGSEDELPGSDGERFLEYWNLVFMQYDQEPEGVLTPLPARNIDTGLGLNRLASILQGTQSVFETDQIRPLITLSEELSGRRYGEEFPIDRAMRILADHTRGMSFLIADGVVPSNEERGYVLRRLMRRAILQGRRIGIEGGFLPRYAERVRELMASAYPELHEQAETIDMWLRREEEAFGQTLESGSRILAEHIERAKARGEEGIGAEAAFQLHDTYGFPLELTLELAGEQGLGVDEQGFEEMMEQQRRRARSAAGRGGRDELRERVEAFAEKAGRVTDFTGYETLEQATEVAGVETVERQAAGQARRVAVLRHRRRPGGRLRRGRVRARRLRGQGARRRARRRGPGARARAGAGRAARGRARDRARRGRRAPAHRVQPHRDAPAARGAARAPRRPRAPGRLLRRARQAALRLHPRRAAERRGRARRRGPRQRVDPRQPARARADDDARRGAAARRDGAVRREVRRRRADGRGRRRPVVARAVRRHARALDGRDRRLQDHHRDLERGQRAPYRGDHRPRRRSGCCASHDRELADAAATLRTSPENVAEAGGRARAAPARAREAGCAPARRRATARAPSRSSCSARRRSTACACSPSSRRSPSRRR